MMPFDGSGHGKSHYWPWQAQSIAENNGERCECWKQVAPQVDFVLENEIKIVIHCSRKILGCRQEFPETEKELKDRFYRFYKGV